MAIRRSKNKTDETLVDLVEARDSASDFLDNNQNNLLIGLVAIVLLIGGYFAYKMLIKAPKEKEAAMALDRAQEQFARDSFALALTNSNNEYLGFLDIIDEYSGTAAANPAAYYYGICYLHLGDYEASIAHLTDFSEVDDILPVTKNGAIGDAYSELGNFESAIDYYQKAVKLGKNDFLISMYLKKLGLLHEKQGNFQASADAYKQIKRDHPTSNDGRDIDKYISRVEARL